MIVDDVKLLVMVGIMGGEESGIMLEISEFFFEFVFFVFKVIVGCVCCYGFGFDVLYCFECGVDFGGICWVIECVM